MQIIISIGTSINMVSVPSHMQLERVCLDTVVQFFNHPFKNGNHYKSIIINALAIMGLDKEGQ